MSENFEKVSDHIEECLNLLSGDTLNPSKLFTLTIQTIEYLENEFKELSGTEKKDLLFEAFNDLCSEIKHKSLTPEIKKQLQEFITDDLETVVESIIGISKGEFRINEKQRNMILNCLLKLCSCLINKYNKKIERP